MTTPVRALRAGGRNRGIPELTATPVTLMADASEFQPQIADAVYLAWSRAIAIRALYGAAHDDLAWYGGQRRAQLHAGGARFLAVYQYLVAGQSGAAQAQAFHNLVGAIQPGEVFVADFEEGARQALTDWYNTMLSLYGPGISPYLWTYSGLVFGEAQGVLPVQWLADYTSVQPGIPFTLWQFTDRFTVPGVGTADCSLFRGSIDQLAALAYPQAAPAWTFLPVNGLDTEAIGPHSIRLQWSAPNGYTGNPPSPAPGVAAYQVTIRHNGQDVPGFPAGVAKGPNPESHQFNGLKPRSEYTVMVRAVAAGNTHASEWESVNFTTRPA